ncbi:MAG: hypothetical protein Q8P44_09490 [Dehalococcoidia bacterium]|nr:hypothetical protein [Dehalococcoidia bacterium]
MNHWMCSNCDYIFKSEAPPEKCPECKETCTFSDVTCYVPECGGPDNLDARLVAERMRESGKK